MKSRSFHFILLIITTAAIGFGVNVYWSQAHPLTPEGATIVVDTTLDSISSDGFCSLREAIQAANTDSPVGDCPAGQGADTIVLGVETYLLSISGTYEDAAYTGDLDITDDLVITGQGTAQTFVSGNQLDRVFHIDPNETGLNVRFENITIQNGVVVEDDSKGGGGILTSGHLTLDNVVVNDSSAKRGGGVRVSALGSLTISDSAFTGNVSESEGGGIYGDANINLDNVQIVDNEAYRGGGVYCDRQCIFMDVTISANQATYGGGVYNDYTSRLTNVTIDHNDASRDGGGIFNEADLTLVNATISSNNASLGSALFSEATAHLENVTIYQNYSPVQDAALVNDFSGSMDLINTIIADNYDQDCSGDLISLGYNLSSDTTCDLAHQTDLISTDPLLGSLQNNGGNTETHALLYGSPAVDGGTNAACSSMDQRYFFRPADGDQDGVSRCDIGTYELIPGGTLGINPVAYSVAEDAGSVQVAVARTDGVSGIVTVDYFTWEGYGPNQANENADYMDATGTLTWADGDNDVKYITINIVNDQSYEMDETFSVVLYNPTGGAGIIPASREATVTILENDEGFPPATPVPDPDKVYLPKVND